MTLGKEKICGNCKWCSDNLIVEPRRLVNSVCEYPFPKWKCDKEADKVVRRVPTEDHRYTADCACFEQRKNGTFTITEPGIHTVVANGVETTYNVIVGQTFFYERCGGEDCFRDSNGDIYIFVSEEMEEISVQVDYTGRPYVISVS